MPGSLEDPSAGGGFAPGERADAQHEFGEVEGLWEVVVGAEGEPFGHGRPGAV